MIKSKKLLIKSSLVYSIPILLFGRALVDPIFFIIYLLSIPFLYWLINKKNLISKRNTNFLAYLCISILFTLQGLEPFRRQVNQSIVMLPSNLTWVSIALYWICYLTSTTLVDRYLSQKNHEKLVLYDFDETKINRDDKIDSLLK